MGNDRKSKSPKQQNSQNEPVDWLPAIGPAVNRVDGRAKVCGTAQYSAEVVLPKLAHAVVIQSTIAKGKIKEFDCREAVELPGITVFSFKNQPQPAPKPGKSDNLFLLTDDIIRYNGQIIAVVVGNTLEEASQAASLVRIAYAPEPANTRMDSQPSKLIAPAKEGNTKRGDTSLALKQAAVTLTQTYTTPVETHNPMEPFATTAVWNGDSMTIYDSTQAVFVTRDTLCEILGLPPNKVRIITKFIGGGFGCKLSVWAHVPLAAMAARSLQRPVKLVLKRAQMYGPVGFRPSTVQTVSLAADEESRLLAIRHDVVSETSTFADFIETATACSTASYACPNVETSQRMVRLDIGKPTWMRAPGHATGSFALESAMDELAHAMKIDPIELRLRNFAEKDPDSGLPWSSNVLRECYQQGAARFGWHKRSSEPGSMRSDNLLLGLGMATAIHSCWRNPASVLVRLQKDGSALVQTGTQDIGTGTYTVMSQVAAERLSLPLDQVRFELGDTNLPPSPMSGGSTTTGSVAPVVAMAATEVLRKLVDLATADKQSPLFGTDPESVVARNGCLVTENVPVKSEAFSKIIERTKSQFVEARVDAKPGDEESKYSMSTFGAQFAEVTVDQDLGIVRVSRFVGAYGGGRILNAKTARSQMIGGIIFGISMTLMEDTLTDHNLNRIVNNDLAEYQLPVHADMPAIDTFFVEEHDPHINILGVKGIGELGITGASAAIANAIFNATGKRIRNLPITLDKLIAT